jgi:hypothetical protein
MVRGLVVGVLLAVTGCAHLEIEPVAVSDKSKQGLRFGKPVPYVSLGVSGGSCTGQIVWLPDPETEYRADPQTGLFGTVDFKPSLQDGWMLTSFDSTTDSKLSDVISSLTGLFGGAAGGGAAATAAEKSGGSSGVSKAPAAAPAPGIPLGLYRINLAQGCDGTSTSAANSCLKAVVVPNLNSTCDQFAGIAAAPGGSGGGGDKGSSSAPSPGGRKAP